MRKTMLKLSALVLVLCMLLPLAACSKEPENAGNASGVAAEDLFYTLKTKVSYDVELTDVSATAAYTYAGLPQGAQILMYGHTEGSCKDELTWIRLASASDMEAAMEEVNYHIEEVRYDAERYYIAELPKVEAYTVWNNGGAGTDIILCITNDYATASGIVSDGAKVEKKPADVTFGDTAKEEDPTDPPKTQETEPPATEPPATEPPATEPPVVGYPVLTSQSGTWSDIGTAMVVDGMAYEYYGFRESSAQNYASVVSRAANALEGETDVYCLIIPTAIGVVLPDDIAEKYSGWEDQGARLEQIYGMMDSSVIPVNIYDKLMQHRDEYLYYRTDWHWSAIGAYYGYERFCEVKGVAPYTMDDRIERVYDGYRGPFAGKSSSLITDTVYAYEPYYYEEVSMVFTDTNGNRIAWPVICDGDTYGTSGKYLIFAAGDQPIAEFTNSAITDGSVAIVVKESFGNAMMAYFCDHYSTVYEIDYRHWNGDLVEFAREVGADDLIFANNIGMVRSNDRIGELSGLIP